MTHTSTEQAEALQYATALRSNSVFFTPKYMGFIADELERLHARVQEMEAEKARLIEAYVPCPSATEAYMYGITQEKQG